MVGIPHQTAEGNAARHGKEPVTYPDAQQTGENRKHAECRAYAGDDRIDAEGVGVGEGEGNAAFRHEDRRDDPEKPVF